MINVFQPSLGPRELAAVAEVFASNWVGRGARTAQFEAAFAAHLGVDRERVTSVNSCTEALFLAMEAAGVGPGDEVVLPSISFVGAGNAVAARGARPVFCDVDPRTLAPGVEQVQAALTPATKAVIVLHYGGYPGAVADLARLCRDRGVLLVEDAACAIASSVHGQACGTFGDIGMWSFDGMKILSAGDGAMVTARDPRLVERLGRLAYLGMAQQSGFAQAGAGTSRWWEFEVESYARRSIMNDVASAIGLVQLSRLDEFIARRAEVCAYYERELAALPGLSTPPPLPDGHRTSHYMYWIQLEPEARDRVALELYHQGIYTTFRYAPLHRVSAYGWTGSLPGAERAAARTLLLPVHQALTDDEVERVVAALRMAVTRHPLAVSSRSAGAR